MCGDTFFPQPCLGQSFLPAWVFSPGPGCQAIHPASGLAQAAQAGTESCPPVHKLFPGLVFHPLGGCGHLLTALSCMTPLTSGWIHHPTSESEEKLSKKKKSLVSRDRKVRWSRVPMGMWVLSPSLLATVPAISSHSASVASPGSVLQSIMPALRIGPIS